MTSRGWWSLDAGDPERVAAAAAALLESALAFHRTHGDGGCPVCGRTSALSVA